MMAFVSKKLGARSIKLVQGDITHQEVDVIANAANSALSGGGGVDGAIHRAAGPQLLAACRKLGRRCPTGSAVLTPAFDLKAKYVAHAVGPVWSGGENGEPELLRRAYQTCLDLAKEAACQSIAFPSISTGIYGFPENKAAPIALQVVKEHLLGETTIDQVVFVLFSNGTFKVFEKALGNL